MPQVGQTQDAAFDKDIFELKSLVENGTPEDDLTDSAVERIRKTQKKLLSWLNNTPVYLTLQWFDAVEEVTVSTKLHTKRWTTEITERDRMFLELLGVSEH